MRIGSLFIALGFDLDDKKLKSFNEGIKQARNELFALVAASAGGVYAINKFISSAVADSVALQNLKESTGLATDEIERFNNVARAANPNIQLRDTVNLFKQLKDVQSQARWGEGPLGQAGILGIANLPLTEPIDLLMKLYDFYAANAKNWAEGDKAAINLKMKELGIGDEFMPLFSLPRAEFIAAFNQEIATESQRKAMSDYADAAAEFWYQIDLLKAKLGEKVTPYFIEVLRAIPPLIDEIEPKIKRLFDYILDMGPRMREGWQDILGIFETLSAGVQNIDKYIGGGKSAAATASSGILGAADSFLINSAEMIDNLMGKYSPFQPIGNKTINQYNDISIQTETLNETVDEIGRFFETTTKHAMEEQGTGAVPAVR